MALHEQSVGVTDEWYTPPYIFEALECHFDWDVAHPGGNRAAWVPTNNRLTHSSLELPWQGFIWMNPPFGPRNGIDPWLTKFVNHGNGIALVPDRTSAPWWQKHVTRMELVLFVSPKIAFIGEDGEPGRSPAQGTTLMAIGVLGCVALHRASENGLGILMKPGAR